MTDKKKPVSFVRRFVDFAKEFLSLVLLALEVLRRILDLFLS